MTMLDSGTIGKLRARYSFLHPVLFQRSVEKARSNTELFDILDSVPKEHPLIWCEKECRWLTANNIYRDDEFLSQFS